MVINKDLSKDLKQYLLNLDLVLNLKAERVLKLSKTIFYLLKQINKNKGNKQILKIIKKNIVGLTTFYVIENNKLSFNLDIHSTEINNSLPFSSKSICFFSDKQKKFMLVNFFDNKILNINLLLEHISEFNFKIAENVKPQDIISSKFLFEYFKFLKNKNLEISLSSIQYFLEIYIQMIIRKYFAKRFISINKLNILHQN